MPSGRAIGFLENACTAAIMHSATSTQSTQNAGGASTTPLGCSPLNWRQYEKAPMRSGVNSWM